MAKKANSSRKLPKINFDLLRIAKFKTVLAWFLATGNISSVLSIIYYIIWIPVGLFLLWFIVSNFKVGAFDQLMGASRNPGGQTTTDPQSQQPAETTIPGIGKVNVNCVQTSLNEDSIIKIVQEKSNKSLNDSEKAKLQECIIEKEQAPPTP